MEHLKDIGHNAAHQIDVARIATVDGCLRNGINTKDEFDRSNIDGRNEGCRLGDDFQLDMAHRGKVRECRRLHTRDELHIAVIGKANGGNGLDIGNELDIARIQLVGTRLIDARNRQDDLDIARIDILDTEKIVLKEREKNAGTLAR